MNIEGILGRKLRTHKRLNDTLDLTWPTPDALMRLHLAAGVVIEMML